MNSQPRSHHQLHHVNRDHLLLVRQRHGKKFAYRDHKGKEVRSAAHLDRIAKLALPPAWTDVRICSSPHGHLQAVGRDQRGRLQYRYHAMWRLHRDQKKFERLTDFAERLPAVRRRLHADLKRPGLVREKILAALVDILQKTNIRIGNEIYTRTNHSFGLTTLRNQHAKVRGEKVHFHFRAKSGKIRDIEIADRKLSQIVRRCRDLPGQELFAYIDADGRVHDITSTDVNAYIHEIAGEAFTAKDFRTWCGTLKAFEVLRGLGPCESESERAWRSRHLAVVRETAEYLGNTPAICQKYYIHPELFEADRSAALFRKRQQRAAAHLSAAECAALELLKSASRPQRRRA